MRFLFLNQYIPPDPAPTARLLGELAENLRASGHEVEIIGQGQSYQSRPARGGSRLKRELQACWAILRAGLHPRGGRPAVILALSSPPGLLVIAALLATRHRARLAHWAMDLYPELAVALGEIKPGKMVARTMQSAMRWAYRRAVLVVALDEDMRDHLQPFCRGEVRTAEPWLAPMVERNIETLIHDDSQASAPWTWLYSGNLGRAHVWRTLLEAQALLEARGLPVQLVFQGDGASRAPAVEYAGELGLRRCEWKHYVAEADLLPSLLGAQVLIVTQRPETCGLLWPSKLALLERLPRPVLFVGPENGAIARRLRERGNSGVFAPGQVQAVVAWIEKLYHHQEAVNLVHPKRTWPTQKDACAELARWLVECAG